MSQTNVERVINAQTVASTATISSSAIDVSDSEAFCVFIKVHSGTTKNVKLHWQVTNSGESDASLLVGAKDVENDVSWVDPATADVPTIVASLTAAATTVYSIAPLAVKWMRLQVTGVGSNGVDTVVSVWISKYGS